MTDEDKEFIFLSAPEPTGHELEYIEQAFEDNWIGPLGPHIDKFERQFADYVGTSNALAVNSGTSAIHLALRALGIGRGDRILVSDFTFIATLNPILYEDAIPVFVDSERDSWNMDPELLAEELDRAAEHDELPAAVLIAHVYGQTADMDPIVTKCRQYDIPIIEDAAEALGATYRDRQAGTIGDIGLFSFNGNKMITTSTGGMLVSDDDELTDRAYYLARQAKDEAPYYRHSDVGYNYRMSNILAGIGRAQFENIEDHIEARRKNYEYYADALGQIPGIFLAPDAGWGRHTRWLTCATLDPEAFGCGPDDLKTHLNERDIEARRLWTPLHAQPIGREYRSIGGRVADHLFESGICLPSGPGLNRKQRRRVVDAIAECHNTCTPNP